MKIEVVSAVPHPTVDRAVLSRRHRSIIVGSPYEVLPLDSCSEPFPSTSCLANCNIDCLSLANDERSIGIATGALLKIADVTSGREVRNLSGHILPITSLAASNSSVYSWYTGSADFSWTQWDTRMHPSKVLSARTSGSIRSVALSPGDRFVAVGTDNSIQLFDARQRQYVKQWNCSGHKLEFNPTEVLLSSIGHDRIVRFFCLESFNMVSQSDPFLDDIQASAFDSHVMITATNESIQLLTWEPCDILTTVPLKGIEKVIEVSVNGGIEVDFICIGETTERVEMRSYSIEEILSYSPSHELSGSIYEEDMSPLDEDKRLIEEEEEEEEMPSSTDCSSTTSENSPPTALTGSNSSSPLDSSQSNPSSPIRAAPLKARSASQKGRAMSTKSSTSAKEAMSTRSVTPVLTKPPASRATASTHPRAANTRTLSRTRPSPSLADLRPLRNRLGSEAATSTSASRLTLDPKKRSASVQRTNDSSSSEWSITYLGKQRQPCEGQSIVGVRSDRSVTSSPKKTVRKPESKGTVAKSGKTSKPLNREDSSGNGGLVTSWSSILSRIAPQSKQVSKIAAGASSTSRILERKVKRGGLDVLTCSTVLDDDNLVVPAIRLMNRKKAWALNTCHEYLPWIIENLGSGEVACTEVGLLALEQIAFDTQLDKFVRNIPRIGVDVAAEERREKAVKCIEHLKGLITSRDAIYKQLKMADIERLDRIMEKIKVL